MITLLWIFLVAMVLRFLLYFDKFRRLKIYRHYFERYHSQADDTFLQMKRQLIHLFNEAGVNEPVIPRESMVTLTMMRTASIPLFNNITARGDYEIIVLTRSCIEEALGFFRFKMFQCLNPAFWIEFVIKLPEMVTQAIGVLPDSKVPKLLNLLYWILIVVFGLDKGNYINLPF